MSQPRFNKHGNTPGNGPCYVCEHWGADMQPVGQGLMRHEACAPGSETWAEKFPDSYMGKWYNLKKEVVT